MFHPSINRQTDAANHDYTLINHTQIGLHTAYRNDARVTNVVKRLCAMALMRVEDMREAFRDLLGLAVNNAKLQVRFVNAFSSFHLIY